MCTSVEILSNGNYMGLGLTYSNNEYKLNLITVDSQGDTLWTKTLGKSGDDYSIGLSRSIVELKDGNILVAGSYKNTLVSDTAKAVIIKFNNTGDTLWQKTYKGIESSHANGLLVEENGDIVFAGWTQISGQNGDVYIVKLDSAGNLLWEKTYGGTGTDYANSINKLADGGFVLTGSTNSEGAGGFDLYILKIDSLGVMEWDTTIGTLETESGQAILTQNQEILISGMTRGVQGMDGQGYLVKMNLNKNVLWEKTFGNNNYNEFNHAIETNNGDVVAIGYYKEGAASNDPKGWLFKTNADGDSIWSRTFKIRDTDHYFRDIKQTDDGGFIIGGFVFPDGGLTQDMWLVKVDSMGCDSVGCHLVGMDELPFGSAQGTMQIYPNPNNGSFVVSLSKERWLSGAEAPNVKASGQLYIYSITGRLLHQEIIITSNQQFSLHVPAGVYFVEYVNANGAVFREKVIIEY